MAKGPEAFRTISEAADEVGVPQHVLRFWESKFAFIRPMKRAGGRRFYRPADLDVLRGVRRLLHDEGYTIKGVQRLHKEEGASRFTPQPALRPSAKAEAKPAEQPHVPAPLSAQPAAPQAPGPDLDSLRRTLDALQAAKARLDEVLGG